MTACDHCHDPAHWLVFAAYDTDSSDRVHPHVARYPAPLARACDTHLPGAFAADLNAHAATGQWVVRAVPRG